jgi:hypothetical protein
VHIHGQMSPVNAANVYGAAQNERAEANRRAAETRRKLSASRTASESLTDDETFLVGRWLDARPHDPLPGDEYHGSSDSREEDLA